MVRGLVDSHEERYSTLRGQTSATPTSGAKSSEEEEEEKLLLVVWDDWMQDADVSA